MGAMRRLPSSNGAASEAVPVQPQQVVYSSLDDISSRVEIYKGRCAMMAIQHKEPPWLYSYCAAGCQQRMQQVVRNLAWRHRSSRELTHQRLLQALHCVERCMRQKQEAHHLEGIRKGNTHARVYKSLAACRTGWHEQQQQ
jgi:hypothetical protein